MSLNTSAEIQIILPVYNEEDCIESTISEIYNKLSARLPVEFIVSEDGSCDRTKEILKELSLRIPMKLLFSSIRKGYSQAIIDGFKSASADLILCLDSDGQCSPKDFWRFYEQKDNYDIIIGWRKPRCDPYSRRLMSAGFKLFYKILFQIPVHDPSCPFVLIKKKVLDRILNDLAILKQGFWWEFIARVYCKGFTIREIPIEHRMRKKGTTKVYNIREIPKIAISHIKGLLCLWREIKL